MCVLRLAALALLIAGACAETRKLNRQGLNQKEAFARMVNANTEESDESAAEASADQDAADPGTGVNLANLTDSIRSLFSLPGQAGAGQAGAAPEALAPETPAAPAEPSAEPAEATGVAAAPPAADTAEPLPSVAPLPPLPSAPKDDVAPVAPPVPPLPADPVLTGLPPLPAAAPGDGDDLDAAMASDPKAKAMVAQAKKAESTGPTNADSKPVTPPKPEHKEEKKIEEDKKTTTMAPSLGSDIIGQRQLFGNSGSITNIAKPKEEKAPAKEEAAKPAPAREVEKKAAPAKKAVAATVTTTTTSTTTTTVAVASASEFMGGAKEVPVEKKDAVAAKEAPAKKVTTTTTTIAVTTTTTAATTTAKSNVASAAEFMGAAKTTAVVQHPDPGKTVSVKPIPVTPTTAPTLSSEINDQRKLVKKDEAKDEVKEAREVKEAKVVKKEHVHPAKASPKPEVKAPVAQKDDKPSLAGEISHQREEVMASKPVVPVVAKTTTASLKPTPASATSTTTPYSLSTEIQQQRDVVLKAKPVVKVNASKPEVNKTIPQKEIATLPMAGFAGVDSDEKKNHTEETSAAPVVKKTDSIKSEHVSSTATTTVPSGPSLSSEIIQQRDLLEKQAAVDEKKKAKAEKQASKAKSDSKATTTTAPPSLSSDIKEQRDLMENATKTQSKAKATIKTDPEPVVAVPVVASEHVKKALQRKLVEHKSQAMMAKKVPVTSGKESDQKLALKPVEKAAPKPAEIVKAAPKPVEKAAPKPAATKANPKPEVKTAAAKPAEIVKAVPKPAVPAKAAQNAAQVEKTADKPADVPKTTQKTALGKAAELAKELDDDDDDFSFPAKKVVAAKAEPEKEAVAPKPKLQAPAKKEEVKPHHVAKAVPAPEVPKAFTVSKKRVVKKVTATTTTATTTTTKAGPSQAELKAEAKEKELENEVAKLKAEVKEEAAASAAKEKALKAAAFKATSTTTTTTAAKTTTAASTTTTTTIATTTSKATTTTTTTTASTTLTKVTTTTAIPVKVVSKPAETAAARETQPVVALPNVSTAPKLVNFLNSSKTMPKAPATSQQDSSVTVDNKPEAILTPPVSMASFYDEQDQYNPLQKGPKSSTLDLSGDKQNAETQNDREQEKQPQTWWDSIVSWFYPTKPPTKKAASLLSESHKDDWEAWNTVGQSKSKQNSSVTALAAFDDSQHTISISDSFDDLEKEDEEEQYKVEHEDNTQRADAEQQIPVPKESPEVLRNRQVHISNIFSQLEAQDDQIQSTLLGTDDMTEYSRLSKLQDDSMTKMTQALEKAEKQTAAAKAERPLLKHNDNSFEAKPIHDPWKALEAQDSEVEYHLKRNPSLRLLQRSDGVMHTKA